MAMRTTEKSITPEVAKVMLSTMNGNRPLNQARVVEFAIAIEDGQWVFNGETLKMNSRGELFDGQHRLQACVLAGKPFRTLVVEGVEDPSAFATVDVGRIRSGSDVLSIAGLPNGTSIAAMCEILMRYQTGKLYWAGHRAWKPRDQQRLSKGLGGAVTRHLKNTNIPRTELVAFAKKHQEALQRSLAHVRTTKIFRLMSLTTAASGHYIFYQRSPEEADKFITDLATGTNLGKGDSVYWLRERLIGNVAAKSKFRREMILGLMVKAWNKRRAGERTGNLKIGPTEDYPVAQ